MLERIVSLIPAFDRRHADPKQNYGINGVMFALAVRGAAGAVHLGVLTGRHLLHVTEDLLAEHGQRLPAELAAEVLAYSGDFPDRDPEAVCNELRAASLRAALLEEYTQAAIVFRPLGEVVAYHSPVPQYEKQKPNQGYCAYLPGQPCYSDGSATYAEDLLDVLLICGLGAVWRDLELVYRDRLEK